MEKRVICKSCAAEFDETEPKCPYCGTMNYKGAEAEYMGKLQKVRKDMDDLDYVPEKVSQKIVKKRRRFIKVLLLIAGIYIAVYAVGSWITQYKDDLRAKEEMYWRLENYPLMNDMYDRGEYEEMYEYYLNGQEAGGSMYTWTHREFCELYTELLQAREILEEEASGESLSLYDYQDLFYKEARLASIPYNQEMSEDEKEVLLSLAEEEIRDFNTRWEMDEEIREWVEDELEYNNGYLDYDFRYDYVEQWYEGREEKE